MSGDKCGNINWERIEYLVEKIKMGFYSSSIKVAFRIKGCIRN
jgi:hypothetical protein